MKATMAWRCRACDDLVKDYLCVPLTPIVISAAQSKKGGVTEWYQRAPKIIMANVIPPDDVDDLPVVDPNQPDAVPVIPEPVLVDEDEDPEEKEFKKEEEPQEEEDMDIDGEEDENEPELTFPYEETGPLNPPPPAFDSEPEDVIEVEDTVEPKDETVPASVYEVGESSTTTFLREDGDSLLPGFMRRDIDSLFGRIASLSRRLCGRETAHALVEKKGKAKDEYYGKLILDLGNEMRSSVEELEAGVALANNIRRGSEMLRVESLPDHLFISYGLHTLQRTSGNDMRKSSNLVAAWNELL
ncbi:hypothetical protein Tco_0856965 [Tanacetum coccineum]|uniref:Uncharacterized protein n=1 Tax=Tanacetum coccineum TaxID=301880 RepID=A0ABQ5B5Y1_9ASTR